MTVSTTLDRQFFKADGFNKNFPFNFKFFDNSSIFVYFIDEQGNPTGKTLNVDYTLSGALSSGGGTVVFSEAPPINVRVLIKRVLPQTQPTSIRNQGAFFPAVHEDVFDRLTMLVQQSISSASSALQLDISETKWDFMGNRGINLADPIDEKDAANQIWVKRYVGSLIEQGQGPVNSAANVLYTTPHGDVKTVQDMSGSGGAAMIGESHGGTVQNRLDRISESAGKSFKDYGMVADYVSPSNRGTVNKLAWKAMFESGGGRFYGEVGAQYYLGAIAATEILATVTHGQPIFIDLQGGTLWLDMVTPDQGRLTAALIHTTDTPLYCYNGSIRCLTEAVYPTRGIMPFYCNALNKPTRGYGLGDMYIEKMADMFTVAGPMGELVNRISGISFDGHVTANGCYYGFNGQWTGDDVTGAYTSIGANRSYFAYGGSGHDLTVISRDGRNSTGDVIIQGYEKGITQNINLKIIQINGQAPIKVTFTQDRANEAAQSGMTVRAVKIDATVTDFFSGYPPFVVSHQVGDVVQATSNAVLDGLSLNINQDWQKGTASNPQSLVVYTDFASNPRIELNDGARVSLYALNGAALIQNGKTTMSAAARATEFLIPRRMVFNRDTGQGLALVRFIVSFQGLNASAATAMAVEEIWAETAIASTGQTTLRTKKNTRLFGSADTGIFIGLALVGNDYRINITGQSTTYEYNVMCASIEKIAQA